MAKVTGRSMVKTSVSVNDPEITGSNPDRVELGGCRPSKSDKPKI